MRPTPVIWPCWPPPAGTSGLPATPPLPLCAQPPKLLTVLLDFHSPLVDAPSSATPTSSSGQILLDLQGSAWTPLPLGSPIAPLGLEAPSSVLPAPWAFSHPLPQVIGISCLLSWSPRLVFSILKKGTLSCPTVNTQHMCLAHSRQ